MRTHRKLTSHERDKIAYWYAVGERIREVARRLGRSPSSISDEIKRNKMGGRYYSIRAHQASEARKHNSHKNTCSRPAQRCNPMSLANWDLAGRAAGSSRGAPFATGCPTDLGLRTKFALYVSCTRRSSLEKQTYP